MSEKDIERKKIMRIQALANFDINELCGTSWAFIFESLDLTLEYAGSTHDKYQWHKQVGYTQK